MGDRYNDKGIHCQLQNNEGKKGKTQGKSKGEKGDRREKEKRKKLKRPKDKERKIKDEMAKAEISYDGSATAKQRRTTQIFKQSGNGTSKTQQKQAKSEFFGPWELLLIC
jgi:hypothetical protein